MYIKKKNSSCGEMFREENAELFGLFPHELFSHGESVQDPKWQDPIETN